MLERDVPEYFNLVNYDTKVRLGITLLPTQLSGNVVR